MRLPNPAQYQIDDPPTVRRDPNSPNRFIRTPFANNIIPANRIVNPLYDLYKRMVPKPNQNFVENGTNPLNNYIDTQVAANRFTQGDLLERFHEFTPSPATPATYATHATYLML